MSTYGIQVGDTVIAGSVFTPSLAVYNCLVDVIRPTKTNPGGVATEEPVTLHSNMLCAIKWTAGRERLQFDKQTAYRDGTLRCRYCDIKTTDCIEFGGQSFEIVSVVNFRNLNRVLVIGIKRIE